MATAEKYLPRRSIIPHSHGTCPWRLINNGLNIEGLCTNFQCAAYNHMVVINLGFGEFDCARIILERKNKCPICKNKIVPTKYALHKCRWWYVNHYSTHVFPLNTVYDEYVLNDLNCEYIIMEIMPLPKNDSIHSKSQEIICPICLSNVENDTGTIYLRCSHTFHRTCIHRWLQSNESMANTCPMCRDYIIEINELY